jgi:hypothetical protein
MEEEEEEKGFANGELRGSKGSGVRFRGKG